MRLASTMFSAVLGHTALAAMVACSTDPRPPPLGSTTRDAATEPTPDGEPPIISIPEQDGCPPEPDAPGFCGNQVIPVATNRLNLYFVLDRSGSMGDPLPGSGFDKYTNAYVAVVDLLRSIGHRVHYGAAVFPPSEGGSCDAGVEVFQTARGDAACFSRAAEDGPILSALRRSLFGLKLQGGTPIAPTLDALSDTLIGLPGETAIVLFTDGAPNCDDAASCEADRCLPNIEGQKLQTDSGTISCTDEFNCCDPENAGPLASLSCIDDTASIQAIERLGAARISTYIVGMPGSEAYKSLLDELALAGGTARDGAQAYYAVSDSAGLAEALLQIGGEVAISCDVELDAVPPDPDLVNVYADAEVVPYDEENGWSWTSESSLALRGDACASLKSGQVVTLQVVAGCPTVVY